MTELASEVLGIIAARANRSPDEVSGDTPLADLNLESLDVIEMIFALEEKFDIQIPFNANDANSAGISFSRAGDVVDIVAKLVSQHDAPKPA